MVVSSSNHNNNECDSSDLSFHTMSFDKSGTVLTKDQKIELRKKLGYCTECTADPIQLYTVFKNRLNPLKSTKKPITIEGKSYNGKCLACYPHLDPRFSDPRFSATAVDATGATTTTLASQRKLIIQKRIQQQSATDLMSSSHRRSMRKTLSSTDRTESSRSILSVSSNHSISEDGADSGHFLAPIVPQRSRSYDHDEMYNHMYNGNSNGQHQHPSQLQRSRSHSNTLTHSLSTNNNNIFSSNSSSTRKQGGGRGGGRHLPRGMSIRGRKKNQPLPPPQQKQEQIYDDNDMIVMDAVVTRVEDPPPPPLKTPTAEVAESNGRRMPDTTRNDNNNNQCNYNTDRGERSNNNNNNNNNNSSHEAASYSTATNNTNHGNGARNNWKGEPEEEKKEVSCAFDTNSSPSTPPPANSSLQRTSTIGTSSPYYLENGNSSNDSAVPETSLRATRSCPVSIFLPKSLIFPTMNETVEHESAVTTPAVVVDDIDIAVKELETLIEELCGGDDVSFLIEILMNTMESHPNEERMQLVCLHNIINKIVNAGNNSSRSDNKTNISNSNSLIKIFIQELNLIDLILLTMKNFPISISIQKDTCYILRELACVAISENSNSANENEYELLFLRHDACGIRMVVEAIQHHYNNDINDTNNAVLIVKYAFDTLRLLSMLSEARTPLYQEANELSKCIISTMEYYIIEDNNDNYYKINSIQTNGCVLLSNISLNVETREVSIVSKSILEIFIKVMRIYTNNHKNLNNNHKPKSKRKIQRDDDDYDGDEGEVQKENVISMVCLALKNLSYQEENIRNLRLINNCEICILLENMIDEYTATSANGRSSSNYADITNVSEQIIEDASDILERLHFSIVMDLSLEDSTIESLNTLVEPLLSLSSSSDSSNGNDKALNEIKNIMKAYMWSERLILQCFEVLKQLIAGAENDNDNNKIILEQEQEYMNILLKNNGFIDIILHSMINHQENKEIQETSCSLIEYLVTNNKQKTSNDKNLTSGTNNNVKTKDVDGSHNDHDDKSNYLENKNNNNHANDNENEEDDGESNTVQQYRRAFIQANICEIMTSILEYHTTASNNTSLIKTILKTLKQLSLSGFECWYQFDKFGTISLLNGIIKKCSDTDNEDNNNHKQIQHYCKEVLNMLGHMESMKSCCLEMKVSAFGGSIILEDGEDDYSDCNDSERY